MLNFRRNIFFDCLSQVIYDKDTDTYDLVFRYMDSEVSVIVSARDFKEAENNEFYWDDITNVDRAIEYGTAILKTH